MSAAINLTRRRLAELRESLSTRDRATIEVVGMLGLASGEQLRQLHFSSGASAESSKRGAQHALRRLTRQRLLARLDRRVGGARSGSGGYVYCLGPAGQQLDRQWRGLPATRSRRPHEPGEPFAAHRLACSQLFVDLHVAEADDQLKLNRYFGEPECWRKRIGPFGQPLTLKPDAYVEVMVGERRLHWFAEVDLATESLTVIARKGRAYLDHYRSGAETNVMPRVLWLAPNMKRRDQLERTLLGLDDPSMQLHVVATTQQAIQTMKGDFQ